MAAPFVPYLPLTPEQISADEASRTAFAHLDRAAAVDLAKQDFHVERPSWTSPSQEEGAHVEKYVGNYAAAETLPGGQHVLASSTIPLRTDDDAGQPAPVSLTLQEASEGFTPQNPIVPVVIAKQAQNGIALPQDIRVTPLSSETAEAPAVVGNSLVFANVEPDTDLIEAPLPYGADVSWQLRSQQSPQESALRFALPAGASLQVSTGTPGGAEVTDEGKQLVLVPPAKAMDADGSPVATSYTINGDVLTTHVDLGEAVDFPVLVDPSLIFAGYYGVANGSGSWAGWQHHLTGNFELYEEASGLAALSPHGGGYLTEGEFYIYPPGPHGLPGSAGITRVDLSNLVHESHEESEAWAEIGESNGTDPIYTFNGTAEKGQLPAPLKTLTNLNTAVAFCAEWAGGYDGDPTEPLCDEEYNQGKYFVMDDIIAKEGGTANYNEIRATGATVTYRDATPPNRVVLNDSGYSGTWLKSAPTTWSITGEDEGLGVQEFRLEIPPKEPPEGEPFFKSSINCNGQDGFTGCPTVEGSPVISLSALNSKENGAYQLGPVVVDAAGNAARPASSRVSLYLDHQPPIIGAFTGSLGEAAGGVIGSGNYTLNFSATDGSTALPQSGVRKIEVKVDGHVIDTLSSGCAEPHGPPAEGCYGLSGSTIVNGQSIGSGGHTISVVATDWAGNVESKSFGVTVNEAAYEPVGPGAVNLETGDFKLNATDVSISGGDATLSVSRVYDSSNLAQGGSGPLGPQWALSLPDSAADGEWRSLTKLADEGIAVYTAHGRQLVFTPKEGGGYISPPGYQTDVLTAPSQTEYQITDAGGNYTRFAAPESGAPFVPSYVAQATAAGGLNKVKYFFRTKEGITEPTEVIGPEPSEGACTPTLVQGCRALTFVYANATTAKGEGSTEWGEYKNRLSKVQFTAWEPAKGAMSEPITVAEYAYDYPQGRLRAEWDPRLSTPLKTTYGYDPENHVTAVSLPGQEPWLLHYGTFGSDQDTGRLLSVSRFNAETALWKGEALTNTVLPKLSTSTPAVGTAVSVSSGTWSTTSVAYSYRWERCNALGSGCVPIQGATNETYTPLRVDIGHDLVAQVTATNASGSVVATTVASGEVYSPDKFSFSFGTSGSGAGQMDEPTAVAEQGSGEAAVVWVADAVNHRVDEYKATTGAFLEAFGWGVSNGKEEMQDCTSSCKAGIAGFNPGQLNNPEGIAVSSQGRIVVADSADDRIEEYTNNGQLMRSFGSYGSEPGEFNGPHGIAVTNTATVWVADTENCRVEEFTEGRFEKAIGKCGAGHGEFERTTGVAVSGGDVYVTDLEHGTVQEFTEAGVWVREFGSNGSGPGQFSYPWAITTNTSDSDVYVSSWGDGRVEMFSPEGKYIEQIGHFGSEKEEMDGPSGLAINQNTGTLYIADELNNRVDAWSPNELEQEPIQAAPTPGTTSVTTVDYQVPVSGAGAPHALGAKEDAEWAQKDVPVEATAIFPPTEPQSWPAGGEYKRASIFYMDVANRTVNTASPTGGISTTEYKGATDNVSRTLSPDNREAALKEGSKSAAEAELLSSETTYNGEGTEVIVKQGPQHTATLANGTQMLLRNFTEYLYEQGAPSGGPYDLVTETIEGGKDTSGNLHETRTVHDYYSGQSNLGWELHEPTSTTTSTGKETLETTTTYQRSTGEVEETSTPKGSSPNQASYIGKFARPSDPGFEPTDIARGTSGAVWVLETGPDHIDKFNEKAEYQSQFATEGTGTGQIKGAQSIAVAPNGNIWVADTLNNRVEEFTPAGTPVLVAGFGVANGESKWEECEASCRVGLSGQYAGELLKPAGITVDAHGHVWVSNTGNGYLDQLNEKGEWLKDVGSHGTGAGKLGAPEDLAVDSNGNVWVTDSEDQKVQEFTEAGGTGIEFGTEGTGSGQFKKPWGIAIDPHNGIYVGDTGNERAEIFNEKGEYLSSLTQTNGHKTPMGLSVDAKGELWTTNIGKAANEGHVEQWVAPIPAAGNTGAHTTQTIYYSAGANQAYPNCAKHPEWAGLPCEGKPAKQPGATGTPNLPETIYTYNIWNEPLTVTDTVGTTTRTTAIAYDPAGRTIESHITSSVDTKLAPVTDEYSKETGALIKQSTSEGKTLSITSEDNKLGQMTSYTDASGSTTTYEYEKEKEDRLLKVTDPKGNETYSYNTTTGLLASVKDSAAGTFTASDDVEGNLVTEGYPNGMNATYKYNQVDDPISLVYEKTTHCTTGCLWYKDSVSPSIHGQWIEQTSTFSKENDSYDEIGRLTEAQETPTGKDCTAHLYAFDEDGNRTSLTTRESSTEKCATEGGISQSYSYDTADRLDETGVNYETFGNITSLPAADAGGATLTNTYYVNNALATQEQAGKKISYTPDPAGRTLETAATSEPNTTSHYDGPEGTPSWTATSTTTTRNIIGVTGSLVAIQNNTEEPRLQLANLHGDIIATAGTSETESKMSPTNETSEYGVPHTTITSKYSWLGADKSPTELQTGIIDMGARTYIPQLGRFEQTDPQPGGSVNSYAYTDDDPVNQADPSGEWTTTTTYNNEAASQGAAAAGISESYVGPGAVLAPAVNLQIQEEMNASPPWNASSTYQEFQEGQLAFSQLIAANSDSAGCPEGCYGHSGHGGGSNPLAEAWHWVKSNAHKLVAAAIGAVSTVVIAGVTTVAVVGCAASAALTDDPFVAFDCYKIGIFGYTLSMAAAISTVNAWKLEKD